MKLSADTDTTIDDPSKEQLGRVLADVAGRPGSGFLILAESEMTYMQVAGNKQRLFVIDHQEGSLARHFRSKERFSIEQTLEILSSYCDRGTEWKTAVSWEIPASFRSPGKSERRLRASCFTLWALGAICALASLRPEGHWSQHLAAVSFASFGIGCLLNSIAGFHYDRMWGKSAVVSITECGVVPFRLLAAFYAALSGMLLWAAVEQHAW